MAVAWCQIHRQAVSTCDKDRALSEAKALRERIEALAAEYELYALGSGCDYSSHARRLREALK